MNHLLQFLILIPLVGYAISLLLPQRRETLIFGTAIATVSLHALVFAAVAVGWAQSGFVDIFQHGLKIYEHGDSHFGLEYFFDRNTAVYLLVSVVLSFCVLIFSRYYIHRDPGFKRFFNNVLFFYLGMNLILVAGNFETMFIGWEIIGITSFFLIGFYRDRYLPVKNALKVVSVYRIADVFLLLGIWVCHHYFRESINFEEIKNLSLLDEPYRMGIPLTFLVVAMVKSAQLPFSSWLPRAMEGPTTSSAIFYGSLSVHIGIFLMIRTAPFWDNNLVFKILVISIGLATTVVATFIARVQSTVKTQIAYSSVAQIGLMFVEVALGWHLLALLHFMGNAFLRTYQLLVSPSMLSYLIHDQFFTFTPPQTAPPDNFLGKLRSSIYILSIKEFNLDTMMYRLLWLPLKKIGHFFTFINVRSLLFFFLPSFAAGWYFVHNRELLPHGLVNFLPIFLAAVGFLLIVRAFTKRNSARNAWLLVVANQLFIALAVAFNENFEDLQVYLFLSGAMVSAAIGLACIWHLERQGERATLERFWGHSYEHPRLAVVFMLASLGLAGFPITPTFIGEELILGHVHEQQFLLSFLIALSLIVSGLSVFRIYARLFLGSHDKGYHETAFRSS